MFHVFGVSASKRPCAVSLLVFVSSSCPWCCLSGMGWVGWGMVTFVVTSSCCPWCLSGMGWVGWGMVTFVVTSSCCPWCCLSGMGWVGWGMVTFFVTSSCCPWCLSGMGWVGWGMVTFVVTSSCCPWCLSGMGWVGWGMVTFVVASSCCPWCLSGMGWVGWGMVAFVVTSSCCPWCLSGMGWVGWGMVKFRGGDLGKMEQKCSKSRDNWLWSVTLTGNSGHHIYISTRMNCKTHGFFSKSCKQDGWNIIKNTRPLTGAVTMFLAAGCCKKYGEYEIQYNLVEDLYWIHETYLHFPMDFVCFVLKLSHFESAWFLLNDGLFWGMIIMICSSSFPGFRFVETSQKGGWMIFLRFWNGRFCADRICSDLESCLEFWNWTPVFCMSKDFVNRFHPNRGASWGMNSSGVVVQFLATCMVVEKHWDHKDLSYLYKSLVYNRNH